MIFGFFENVCIDCIPAGSGMDGKSIFKKNGSAEQANLNNPQKLLEKDLIRLIFVDYLNVINN